MVASSPAARCGRWRGVDDEFIHWTEHTRICIVGKVKPVVFRGDSLERLRKFPSSVRQDAGYQLERVQRGDAPDDFKPMSGIGRGVQEIRVRDAAGAFRVIYLARFEEAVYVLHVF